MRSMVASSTCRHRRPIGPESAFKEVNLTRHKNEVWKKWIALYNEKMLSRGHIPDLYVTGYDTPEGYAIEKDGKMYNAFFAPQQDAAWKEKSNYGA